MSEFTQLYLILQLPSPDMSLTIEEEGVTTTTKGQPQATRYDGLDRVEGGGVWYSLTIKKIAHYSPSSKIVAY